ncbi:MAG: glycosyl transferase [Candidatus Pacebacteria bacterium CG10_big_fil_rev_8_21_14_0_10_56_10]|nr:MAG: glycosyl transferase [Candidatus Pacebacteria bacterium CG10_big_fil_rev_8_21_14_0_10_56_10]
MSPAPYLSVIIPSYNELSNVRRGVLDQVTEYLDQQDYSWEVILSDDGSTDGTLAALHQFANAHPGVMVKTNIHAGKGPTVQAGMLAARGKWRLFTDFDQSTPLSEIEKLWPFTRQGCEVVIGSREMIGAKRDKEPWYRHLMGRGFNLLVQGLAIPGILDTQCGFKLFSAAAAEVLFSNLVVYGRQSQRDDAYTGAFDVEVLFLANKYGFHIKEVPIHWHHNETDRVDPLKDSLRMLRDTVRVRLAAVKHRYPESTDQPIRPDQPQPRPGQHQTDHQSGNFHSSAPLNGRHD